MTVCEKCGLRYCEDAAEDRQEHRERHRRRDAVSRDLGYLPATYRAQEQGKSEGWALVGSGTTLEARVAGAEMVLRGWFDRSLDAAIRGNYWRRHPSFAEYARMNLSGAPAFGDDVLDALSRKYGSPIAGEIAPGMSYWHPPQSEARADQWRAHYRRQER